MSDELWDIIEGRVPRPYSSGCEDGLVRALGWGDRTAWRPLEALVAKLHEIEDKVDGTACPHCGQYPIFRKEDDESTRASAED